MIKPEGHSHRDAATPPGSVSVVIPVRDDPRLSMCLAALARQTYPAHLIEVLVVDNGSQPHLSLADLDRPSELARLRVVRETQTGSYRARNTGVTASSGEFIAFTDADCVPSPEWIEQAVRALRGGAHVVAGAVDVFARGGRLHPIEAYELVHAFPQERYVREHGGGVTANLVVSRTVFDEVGPFTPGLSGADIEWGHRARSLGYPASFVRQASVRHPARRRFSEMATKIDRVVGGSADRARAWSDDGEYPWPPVRELRPPLGAAARARRLPHGATPWSVLALFVGETFCRYVGSWHQVRAKLSHHT